MENKSPHSENAEYMASLPPNAQEIVMAHKKGTLHAHMLEFQTTEESQSKVYEEDREGKTCAPRAQLDDFLGILKGDPTAHYINGTYKWNIQVDPENDQNGHPMLATTLMKESVPVPLYAEHNRVGLLFDNADEKNITPLHVSMMDVWSELFYNNRRFTFQPVLTLFDLGNIVNTKGIIDNIKNGEAIYGEMDGKKILKCLTEGCHKHIIDLGCKSPEEKKAREELVKKAREDLSQFWNIVEPYWEELKYTTPQERWQGINEINVAANIKGLKGLIVYHRSDVSEEKMYGGGESVYNRAVAEAVQVRDKISQKYPELFPEPLPIFSYDLAREKGQQLEMIPPKEIEKIVASHAQNGEVSTSTAQLDFSKR